jgi:hypothetical protein
MSGLRDEAETLAKALEFGVCDVAEAIAWADARLLREVRPPRALCEVSLSQGRYPQDVAGLLRQCPGTPDESAVWRLLTVLLKDLLNGGEAQAGRVASGLYQMAIAEAIEAPRLRMVAWWAWDALDLAAGGQIEESREDIVRGMADALEEAVGNSATTWLATVANDKPYTPSS